MIGAMREVADGVVEVLIGYAHAHLVVVDDGVVLVDTGLPGRAHRIERALHGLRRQVGDVHTILLTHHHPDHTAGHVSYLLDRAGGVLFAGDAAAGGRRRLGSTPAMVTADAAAARRSVARLAELDFETAVFGHGPAMRGRAVDHFRQYAAGD